MGVMLEVKSYKSDSLYQSVLTCLSPPGDLQHGVAVCLFLPAIELKTCGSTE